MEFPTKTHIFVISRYTPHQSRLGNSSNFSEIPRHSVTVQWRASPARAGFRATEDYKGRRALKSCHSEFHRILWCGSHSRGHQADSQLDALSFCISIQRHHAAKCGVSGQGRLVAPLNASYKIYKSYYSDTSTRACDISAYSSHPGSFSVYTVSGSSGRSARASLSLRPKICTLAV